MRWMALFAFLLSAGAWASNPGEPLDCSDWVVLEPGLFCVEHVQFPCNPPALCSIGGRPEEIDNQGRFLKVRRETLGLFQCPGVDVPDTLYRTRLIARYGDTETLLAFVDDRCGAFGEIDTISPSGQTSGGVLFDDKAGSLFLTLIDDCKASDPCDGYGREVWLARIDGFATAFEIFQSYEPRVPAWSFRVPSMPEGFPAADSFDSYYGPLTVPIELTDAQPLACDFPASPPLAGTYLTVADSLPPPALGQGYWYVTAVNYMAQRRYGRQRLEGILSGRDPALLPVCE